MKTRPAIAPAIVLFAFVFALSACGNKGPLVLPDEAAQDTFEDEAPMPMPADEVPADADAPPVDAGDVPQDDDGR
ncbi:sugar transporter [Luteimonas aestuarii]|uniref:Sugar transporter n=1 Tax=Luteimonas aestuarii TaxID=453837 RepID=A0A4R5TK40_9GAMM|nr:lipoprotein [Luteimonas aestuarii]TDK22738.1 sugar transporter [Luteimonas aestuarii]